MDGEVDIETEEEIETPAVEAALDEDTEEAPDSSDPKTQPGKTDGKAPYVPFSTGGKEKFKVNGKEFEWDWDTTKRYAQLGRSGQVAMERAAQVEKKAKETFSRLTSDAKTHPIELIRILRGEPNWNPSAGKAQRAQSAEGAQEEAPEEDERDHLIQELRSRLEQLEGKTEQADIAAERQAIEGELDAAAKLFPEMEDQVLRHYVKSQYTRSLKAGLDVTIEDVAFHIVQDRKEKAAEKARAQKDALTRKREKAPITAATGSRGKDPDEGSDEDAFTRARKLAGMA